MEVKMKCVREGGGKVMREMRGECVVINRVQAKQSRAEQSGKD